MQESGLENRCAVLIVVWPLEDMLFVTALCGSRVDLLKTGTTDSLSFVRRIRDVRSSTRRVSIG